MSNINKTTHENYPVKIHPIYNLKNFMKIVDKHITPEDLKKPVHPVYNLKNFMKIVDKVLEKEKIKQQNAEEWITIKGNHIKLKDGETKEQAVDRFIKEKQVKSKADISEILGKEYKNVKGKDAIDLLIQKKEGWVPDAFTRKDIGNIALIWGNSDFGLKHIIERRKKTGQNLRKLLISLDLVITHGKISKAKRERLRIDYKNKIVIISKIPERECFIFTAYYVNNKK